MPTPRLLAFVSLLLLLTLGCSGVADKARSALQPAPDPLSGRSLAEICGDNSLAMIRWDYDELQRNFRGLCCGSGGLGQGGLCEMDWPFNDVPRCSDYDVLRNGIYARYGYPFQEERWKREFGARSWYQVREDFSPSWLSAPASRNIEKLKSLKASRTGCMG